MSAGSSTTTTTTTTGASGASASASGQIAAYSTSSSMPVGTCIKVAPGSSDTGSSSVNPQGNFIITTSANATGPLTLWIYPPNNTTSPQYLTLAIGTTWQINLAAYTEMVYDGKNQSWCVQQSGTAITQTLVSQQTWSAVESGVIVAVLSGIIIAVIVWLWRTFIKVTHPPKPGEPQKKEDLLEDINQISLFTLPSESQEQKLQQQRQPQNQQAQLNQSKKAGDDLTEKKQQ